MNTAPWIPTTNNDMVDAACVRQSSVKTILRGTDVHTTDLLSLAYRILEQLKADEAKQTPVCEDIPPKDMLDAALRLADRTERLFALLNLIADLLGVND